MRKRYIDRIPPLAASSRTPDGEFREAMNLIFASLHFGGRDAAGGKVNHDVQQDDSELTKRFYAYLSECFYKKLYVRRVEVDDILEKMKRRHLLMVKGHAGSGKSTLLRYLKHTRSNQANEPMVYFDIYDHPLLLGSDVGAVAMLWDRIADYVVKSIIFPEETLRQAWQLWQVRELPAFAALREAIVTRHAPKTDADWVSLLKEKEYGEWFERNLERYSNDQWNSASVKLSRRLGLAEDNVSRGFERSRSEGLALERLRGLFQCLTANGIHCYFVLDNLDQFNLRVQQIVVDQALDLAHNQICTPVLALRQENFLRLRSTAIGDQPWQSATLDNSGPNRLNVDVCASAELIANFIEKRVTVALDYHDEHYSTLNRTQSREIFSNHTDLLRNFARSQLTANIIVSAYLGWHNDSLRATALHVFNLLDLIVRGKDSYFTYDDLRTQMVAGTFHAMTDRNITTLRTLIYRHLTMVFYGQRPGFRPGTPAAFEPQHSMVRGREFYFVKLKMLSFLQARDGEATYDEVRSCFRSYGVTERVIYQFIRDLANKRNYNPTGLIFVDAIVDPNAGSSFKLELTPKSTIKLLPAGRFFLEHLVVSCEYLFWSAMNGEIKREGGYQFFPKADQVNDDGFRVDVVVTYLERQLAPRFRKEFVFGRQQDNRFDENIRRHFGIKTDAREHIFVRILNSMESFLSTASIEACLASKIRSRLHAMRDSFDRIANDKT